jgi:hypothetical protein
VYHTALLDHEERKHCLLTGQILILDFEWNLASKQPDSVLRRIDKYSLANKMIFINGIKKSVD